MPALPKKSRVARNSPITTNSAAPTLVVTAPQRKSRNPSPLQMRLKRLADVKIHFIKSLEFQDGAVNEEFLESLPPRTSNGDESHSLSGEDAEAGVSPFLANLYEVPLLNPREERHLFRQFNYLKFLANQARAAVDRQRPKAKQLEKVEQLLQQARDARDHLVRANLRLVAANARQFADPDHSFEDLVSDGTLSVVQAVEQFDYSRGFRFSTYATHAIRRTYFRRMSRKQKEKTRLQFTPHEVLADVAEPVHQTNDEAHELKIYHQVLNRMEERLSEREHEILKARFNLETSGDVPTLTVLAERLGICKERVRQLQNRAISKLQQFARELQSQLAGPTLAPT